MPGIPSSFGKKTGCEASQMKRAVRTISLVCFGITVALLFSELILRAFFDVSTVRYDLDKEIGSMLVPNQRSRWVNQDYDVEIITNSAGFHDVEHSIEKVKGQYRIVVLGDSFIEGLQVPIENGFTRQLEVELQKKWRDRQVEVINLGLSGLGPAQYYHILKKKGLRYRPDIVIMVVLPDNDFRDSHAGLSGSKFKPYYSIDSNSDLQYLPPQVSRRSFVFRSFLKKSVLLQRVRKLIGNHPVESWLAQVGLLAPDEGIAEGDQLISIPLDWYVFVQDPPDPWPEAYAITKRMIRESKTLADTIGAKFVVMLIGSTAMIEDRWEESLQPYVGSAELSWNFNKPFHEIEQLGKETGFEVVNLVEPFRKDFERHQRSQSFPHDGHWNPQGHQLAAKIISEALALAREMHSGELELPGSGTHSTISGK